MDQCRPCGCKGRRSCLICEQEYDIPSVSFLSRANVCLLSQKENSYVFCDTCGKAWPGWDIDSDKDFPNHCGENISVSGIYLQRNFLTDDEKQKLLSGMSKENWDLSQSGRRKQNYGPKCNFKKNKIQIGNFKGFPSFFKFVHDKLKSVPILKDFNVIEQCSLEYDPKRGASIDPHVDDCWIWGERIVTVNVLGDTFLTLSKFKGDKSKYNLDKVKSYNKVLDENGCVLDAINSKPFQFDETDSSSNKYSDVTLRVFMPEKSLLILYGSARYEWEHYILREDIKSSRICLAYREFTPPYLLGGDKENFGANILNTSKLYW